VVVYGRQETCSGILIGSAWAVSLDILVFYAWSWEGYSRSRRHIMQFWKEPRSDLQDQGLVDVVPDEAYPYQACQ
jgi:hypothetical protein